jgi:hypothetical protein
MLSSRDGTEVQTAFLKDDPDAPSSQIQGSVFFSTVRKTSSLHIHSNIHIFIKTLEPNIWFSAS